MRLDLKTLSQGSNKNIIFQSIDVESGLQFVALIVTNVGNDTRKSKMTLKSLQLAISRCELTQISKVHEKIQN